MPEEQNPRQQAEGEGIAQADRGGTANVSITRYEHVPARPVDTETLEKAHRRLEELPLDEVPGRSALPPNSVMPFSPNPLFVGREDQLKAIASNLKAGDTTAIGQVNIAATTGLGGVGKTQLASEFVHQYGGYFCGGVYWLSFSDPSAVPAEVAACGEPGRMDLWAPDFDQIHSDEQKRLRKKVRLVRSAWQSPLPRLLVFDTCEDERLLDQWRPCTGGCRVLVTSRKEQWAPVLGVKPMALDALSRPESIALLHEHRPDLSPQDSSLDSIAGELGDLPLALDLAGRYLARYRRVVTAGEYLAQLRSPDLLKHPSLQRASGVSPTGHELSVARTFALSYERLDTADPTDELAVQVLTRVARFAPDEPIPRDLLVSALHLSDEDSDADLQAEDALMRLTELGLVTDETGSIRMHRLVAAYARDVVADEDAQGAVEETLADAAVSLVQGGSPVQLLPLLPHLRVATDFAREREDEQAAYLCHALGICLWSMDNYGEARPYSERALELGKRLFGPEHPTTLRMLHNLVTVLKTHGSYEEARPLYEQALETRERVLGPEHPDTAASLNNLGVLLRDQGHYEEARPLYERALGIRKKALGPEHHDTAESLHNMGALLMDLDRCDEARPHLEEALEVNEKVLGREHLDNVGSLSKLGSLRWREGNYAEARQLYERALEIREIALDDAHPDIFASLDELGSLLADQGAYDEAQSYLERALAISEETLGDDEPTTLAMSLDKLAGVLVEQGDYDEAFSLRQRELSISEDVLGEDHPQTAQCLHNIATIFWYQGLYAEAHPYSERAASISENALGKEHPDTATALDHLANVLFAQNLRDQARPLFERALSIRKKVVGEEHFDTAISLNNLSNLLRAQGLLEEAILHQRQALDNFRKVAGEEHPHIATGLHHLAVLLQLQGRYDEARPHVKRALTVSDNVFGSSHPFTEHVRENLRLLDS